jgi:hypothetical protein
MATDLSSSSTVRSPGDADVFFGRVIQFPLQLRNGWLPKQFHYSFALILLSVSPEPSPESTRGHYVLHKLMCKPVSLVPERARRNQGTITAPSANV